MGILAADRPRRLESAVILEHLLQTLTGKEDAALHSSQRQIHFLCYFIIFITSMIR